MAGIDGKMGRKHACGDTLRKSDFVESKPVVFKMVQNPEFLTKRQMADLKSGQRALLKNSFFDDLDFFVEYSLNKKQRWDKLGTVEDVLRSAVDSSATGSTSISAVEKYALSRNSNHTFGRLNPESDVVEVTKTKSGKGTSLKNLKNTFEKRKTRRNCSRDAESEAEPEVVIIIEKPYVTKKVEKMTKSRRKTTTKSKNLDLLEAYEDYLDCGVYRARKSARILKDGTYSAARNSKKAVVESPEQFKLADFIVDDMAVIRKNDRKNVLTEQGFELVDEYLDGLIAV